MIVPTKDMVLLLHQLVAQESGGDPGLRDEALLEGALASAFRTFGGKDLHPTKEEKAAALGHALVSDHAFVDGNKRIGMHIMLTFLEVNGIHMNCTNDDVVHAGLSVADGSMKYEELLAWVREHEDL